MKQKIKPFFVKEEAKAKIAIFLSGTGTNAQKILEYEAKLGKDCHFQTTCIVTDCPKTSKANQIAEQYNLPVVKLGLKKFYLQHGLKTTSLTSEKGCEVRQRWTHKLIELLKQYKLDFGVFAGFVPLSNITDYLPCLNIHPGDLTYQVNNQRVLTGLHTIPIARALEHNLTTLRSTVIIASSYQNIGIGTDEGTIIALSKEVPVKLPTSYEKLLQDKQLLQKTFQENQENLKINGDWRVFPYAINDFAKGVFYLDENDKLLININKNYLNCQYIEYDRENKNIILSQEA